MTIFSIYILFTTKNDDLLGLAGSVINGAGFIPIFGKLLQHAGNDIYGSLPGIQEAVQVYRDDPLRAINALTATISSDKTSFVRNFQYNV